MPTMIGPSLKELHKTLAEVFASEIPDLWVPGVRNAFDMVHTVAGHTGYAPDYLVVFSGVNGVFEIETMEHLCELLPKIQKALSADRISFWEDGRLWIHYDIRRFT